MNKICALVLSVSLFFSLFPPLKGGAEEFELVDNARSAILMEQDTGTVLYEKNSEEPLPPASMTKLMTMLLVMEALETGKIRYTDKVRASAHAAGMGGSQIFLEEGEEMTVEELFRAVAIGSANDASVALAEKIAGSEEAFVKMMNDKAKALGLKNTQFRNSTGLPAENHYSSAKDMAILARELLKYQDITKFTGQYESYLRKGTEKEFWLVNTNRLVRFYPGVDGLKTGFTSEAKYCLTATAKKDGMRVIAVIFGAPTSKERNRQIAKMFDYAFAQFETAPLYKSGDPVGEARVTKGAKTKVTAVVHEPIALLKRKGEELKGYEHEVHFLKLQAPVKKGEVVGAVIVKKEGKVIKKWNVYAKEDIQPATWWTLFKRTFGQITKINKAKID
jgi:D-Ala-D-Ala carboxypeptidase DacF. Serine peptidase. MEROPS family S11